MDLLHGFTNTISRARSRGQAALTAVGMKRRAGGGTRLERRFYYRISLMSTNENILCCFVVLFTHCCFRTRRRGKPAARAQAPAAIQAPTQVPAPRTQVGRETQRRSQRNPRRTQRTQSRNQVAEVLARLMRRRRALRWFIFTDHPNVVHLAMFLISRLLPASLPLRARKMLHHLPRRGRRRPRSARPGCLHDYDCIVCIWKW